MGFWFNEFSDIILESLGTSMVLIVIFGLFSIAGTPEGTGIFQSIWLFIQTMVGG